jgi:hypothetical protein
MTALSSLRSGVSSCLRERSAAGRSKAARLSGLYSGSHLSSHREPEDSEARERVAVRYAATAVPHRVRRNALSFMVETAQNLGAPTVTHAHLHALRMLFAYWP